ncbi:YebC-like protein [Pterulicium gracile]|uniref:YebC-like protein n=1 Tax=Pterulicium gracile TaxID=1884261 RepID=A0A5C3QY16_9AGAR|nr:YebC-like protein [Pterula gracilis]
MLGVARIGRRHLSYSAPLQAGHNKWSKIQQKKGVNDTKKSTIYQRSSRDIAVAARNGGSADPEKNHTLALVLQKARSQGVPKENIEAALQRAQQRREKGDQSVSFEALAQRSVGIIVECMTDNNNRTSRTIKEVLGQHDAQLTPVGFMFARKGFVEVAVKQTGNQDESTEELINDALTANAEDFNEVSREEQGSANSGLVYEFSCLPEHLKDLTSALGSSTHVQAVLASELRFCPAGDKPADQTDELRAQISDLVDALNECDDTLKVWTTLETS